MLEGRLHVVLIFPWKKYKITDIWIAAIGIPIHYSHNCCIKNMGLDPWVLVDRRRCIQVLKNLPKKKKKKNLPLSVYDQMVFRRMGCLTHVPCEQVTMASIYLECA